MKEKKADNRARAGFHAQHALQLYDTRKPGLRQKHPDGQIPESDELDLRRRYRNDATKIRGLSLAQGLQSQNILQNTNITQPMQDGIMTQDTPQQQEIQQ